MVTIRQHAYEQIGTSLLFLDLLRHVVLLFSPVMVTHYSAIYQPSDSHHSPEDSRGNEDMVIVFLRTQSIVYVTPPIGVFRINIAYNIDQLSWNEDTVTTHYVAFYKSFVRG